MKEKKQNIKKSSGNVFKDLGLANPEDRLAKAALASQINQILEEKSKKNQKGAAILLGIDQPKISALSQGNLAGFSLERLIKFLRILEKDIDIVVREKPDSTNSHTAGHLNVVRQIAL